MQEQTENLLKQPQTELLRLGSNITWTVTKDIIKVNDTLLAYRAGITQIDRRFKPKGEVWWIAPGLDPLTHGHIADAILTTPDEADSAALFANIRNRLFGLHDETEWSIQPSPR